MAGGRSGPVRVERRVAPAGEAPWTWHHLERTDPEAASWLAGRGVPEQVVEGLLDENTRPRLARAPGGLLLILRLLGEGGEPSRPDAQAARSDGPPRGSGLRLWIEPGGIVSLAAGEPPELATATALVDADPPATVFLADWIERIVDRFGPTIGALVEEADALEEGLIGRAALAPDEEAALAARLAMLRRVAVRLHRFAGPQHAALAALAREVPGGAAQLDIAESAEQTQRDAEMVEEARERALILRDELARLADARTARHAFILSVAAAVFLPATFITGLLGINVGGVPGADHPNAFWWVVAICLAVAAGSTAFVLLRRWL